MKRRHGCVILVVIWVMTLLVTLLALHLFAVEPLPDPLESGARWGCQK